MLDRREALAALGAGTAFSPVHALAKSNEMPKGFLWGAATAGHQIEGNNVASDYWLLENLPITDFNDRSGDACDSWVRWRKDIALVSAMGLNTYRFSIEWARIEPEPGQFSAAVLDQYRRMCAACREAGIMPLVTFHHFVSPRWFAANGGWDAPDGPERFARYVARAAKAVGDLIGAACTMNEPNAQVTSYVMRDEKPAPKELAMVAEAKRRTGSDRWGAYFMGDAFRVRDACIVAHRLATEAIKSAVPGLKTGLTLALQDLRPGPGGEARYKRIFEQARRPFYEACAQDDFIGPQMYNRFIVGPTGYLPAPAGALQNRWNADASPDVLPAVLREVHDNCGAPMLVSENGIDTNDDAVRARHLTASIAAMRHVMDGGLPVLGYIHWSLIDNYEWRSGFAPKYGLHAVDPATFERTAKPSAAVFREMVRRAGAKPVARL
jgi:beta-glucosidase